MARVPYLTAEELPAEYRHLLRERPINLRRAMVNLPALAELYAGIAEWFRFEAQVEPRLRELAILYVGYANASAYAFCQHVRIGTQHGLTDADIDAVIDRVNGRPTALPELETAVLDAAEELTLRATLGDDGWEALVGALGPTGAMELTLAIAHYNYVVRMLGALRIDVEQDWSEPLERYDPPDGSGGWH